MIIYIYIEVDSFYVVALDCKVVIGLHLFVDHKLHLMQL